MNNIRDEYLKSMFGNQYEYILYKPSKEELENFCKRQQLLEMQIEKEQKQIKKLKLKDDKKKKKPSKYNSAKLKIWRDAVLSRDNYTCQNCGNKNKLHAHHIKHKSKYIELCYDVSNGITLCGKCHEVEHPELHGRLKF